MTIKINWESRIQIGHLSVVKAQMDIWYFARFLFVIWFQSIFVMVEFTIFNCNLAYEKGFALFRSIEMCFFIFFCQVSCLNFSISEVDLWIHFVQKVFQKLYWLSEMRWIKDPLILFARIKFV